MFLTKKSAYGWVDNIKRISLIVCTSLLGFTGCKTLDTIAVGDVGGIPQVGPQTGPQRDSGLYSEPKKKHYPYLSEVYLDVVIPVFDPGLPLNEWGDIDYKSVEKQGIWPQLRRSEANRFAVETRRAVEKLNAFGAVSVVPSAFVSGDVYILGHIMESDSETIRLAVAIVDSQGKSWGKKEFTHQVAEGFFRDRANVDKDPYEPIFNRIADYIYQRLAHKSETEKKTIKTITDLRYAQLYSPEVFGQHIKVQKNWAGNTEYQLVSLPSENAAMVQRIKPLKVQDQLFIDRLQPHYEGFNARSDESYRTWQKETLPEVVSIKKNWGERNLRAGAGIALATLAVLLSKNSNSKAGDIGTTVGLLASGFFINSALNKNAELKIHKQSIDELGESLDIELSPQLMVHNDHTVELTGTANEQYQQWKNHLKAIYELEKTPNKQL
ncbi:hypothetical protein AB835_00445 [Candidatus Endobugula sertula]|uniref:Lipoprotein n=1 Tax=Candidatus Endobugula sertula TaxID=62101 RepID=A0A1D2QTZ1_9GAMM|nr:hypothetical protein AB835_00445 [Candidatus Endobugula sertula]